MPERVDISDLVDEFVICRTLGHAWDDDPSAEVDSDLFRMATAVLCLRCTRCGTNRFDYINQSMAVYQRYYRYPPLWHTIPGQGRGRVPMRGEMIKRSLLVRTYKPRAAKTAAKVMATV